MNNAVGYARPARFANPVVLGTDGIGADMLDEFRLAYVRLRESDVTATPDTPWTWLANGWTLFPEARDDRVTWSYDRADDPWSLAFTTGVRPLEVRVDDEVVWRDGVPTRVDAAEVRARAAEQAARACSPSSESRPRTLREEPACGSRCTCRTPTPSARP